EARELLRRVVRLVGRLRAAEEPRHGACVEGAAEPGGGAVERLVPARWAERVAVADERLGQPWRVSGHRSESRRGPREGPTVFLLKTTSPRGESAHFHHISPHGVCPGTGTLLPANRIVRALHAVSLTLVSVPGQTPGFRRARPSSGGGGRPRRSPPTRARGHSAPALGCRDGRRRAARGAT